MSKKEKTPGRGKWALIYTGAFILSFAASAIFKMTYDPTHGKYKADWSDSVGTVYTDISYGKGEANKFDLYLPADSDKMVSVITDNARLFMPMADLVDIEAEKARLTKEIEKTEKLIAGQEAKRANANFVSRAPEAVVNVEREKKAKLEALLENLKLSLANL